MINMKKLKTNNMEKTNLLSVFNDPNKFMNKKTALKVGETTMPL